MTTNPANPVDGTHFTLNVLVTNIGTATSPGTTLRLVQGVGGSSVTLATASVPTLSSTIGSNTLIVPFTMSGFMVGSYALGALVNPSASFAEGNVTNNSMAISVTVLPTGSG